MHSRGGAHAAARHGRGKALVMMIQVTRADDLDRQAQRLEAEATELEQAGEGRAAYFKKNDAHQTRLQAERLRRGRTDGVRFG